MVVDFADEGLIKQNYAGRGFEAGRKGSNIIKIHFFRSRNPPPLLSLPRPPNITQDPVDRPVDSGDKFSPPSRPPQCVSYLKPVVLRMRAKPLNIRLSVDEYFLINSMDVWNGSGPRPFCPLTCIYTVHPFAPGRSLYSCNTE